MKTIGLSKVTIMIDHITVIVLIDLKYDILLYRVIRKTSFKWDQSKQLIKGSDNTFFVISSSNNF